MATAKKPSAAKKALVAKRRKVLREKAKATLPMKMSLSIFQKARELPPVTEDEDEDPRKVWRDSYERKMDERYEAYLKRCEEIRVEVIRRAGDDVLIIPIVGDPKRTEIRVPRAPFYNWALGRTGARHLAPKWEPVAPSGMKLQLDDPYHTDWMLGAGLDLEDDYGFLSDTPINKATSQKRWEIVTELTDYKSVVFSHGKARDRDRMHVDVVEGVVGQGILVIPDLRPFRQPEVMKAKAVITNVGGALAHLAIIAREESIPMLMIPKATEKFPPGTFLRIYPYDGGVHIAEKPMRWEPGYDTLIPFCCANCGKTSEGTMLMKDKDDTFCESCMGAS